MQITNRVLITCLQCRFSDVESSFDLINDKYICPQCCGFKVEQGYDDFEIKQTGNDFAHDQKMLLEASIKYEQLKQGMRDQSEIIKLQRTIIEILGTHVEESLEAFEAIFKADDSIQDPERMQQYIILAQYMQRRYNRPCIAGLVEHKLKSLPSSK